jgi:hypothetical protein
MCTFFGKERREGRKKKEMTIIDKPPITCRHVPPQQKENMMTLSKT